MGNKTINQLFASPMSPRYRQSLPQTTTISAQPQPHSHGGTYYELTMDLLWKLTKLVRWNESRRYKSAFQQANRKSMKDAGYRPRIPCYN